MRIVELVPSLDVGGAERMAALMALELKAAGHDVALVSLYDSTGSWIEAELRAASVPLHFLGKRPGLDLRVIPKLRRLLLTLKPEVVHTHLHTLKYVLPAGPGGGFRVVHTIHNLAQHEIELAGRLLHHVAFRTGVVPVAIGEAVAESVRRVYRLAPGRTIPNGIPLRSSVPPDGAREDLRRELGFGAEEPVVVTVGRLNPQKNQALLLDAFARAPLAAQLLIVGDGELRAQLTRQAADLGVGARVHFLGVRRDIPSLLAAADVFALASSWEGNPLVVMEAMAARLPVVATSVGCVPELVAASTGRLVPPSDPVALSAALTELCADLPLARSLGAAGYEVARARFDAPVMARAYTELFAVLTN